VAIISEGISRQPVFEFEGFTLDLASRRLVGAGGAEILLRPRVFDLLAFLVSNPGELLDKHALLAEIWPDIRADENNLNQAISVLRGALGEDAHKPRLIATVPRRGYQFVASVRAVDASLGAQTSVREPADPLGHPLPRARGRSWLSAVVAAVVVSLLLGAAMSTRLFRAPSVASEPPTIAVLPFDDLSPGADQGYFVDGLAEELIDHLARVEELQVISRSSSFTFRAQNASTQTIGAALGATRLLQGSVRRAGEQVRVSATLIDAPSGMVTWSQTFERRRQDVFRLQNEIARAVTNALLPELGVEPRFRSIGGTTNIDAYEAVLKARAWDRLGGDTDLEKAIDLYREALQHDPDYAEAWAELARMLVSYQYFVTDQTDDVTPDLERAVDRALELEPDLWLAHAIRGEVRARRRDWTGAMQSYARYRELVPEEARVCAAMLVPYLLGDAEEGVACTRAARALDPLSINVSRDAMIAFMRAGRDAEAVKEYERGRDLVGNRVSVEHYRLMQIWNGADADEIEAQMRIVAGQSGAFGSVVAAIDRVAALALLQAAATDPVYRDSLRLPILAAWISHYGDPELAAELLYRAFIDLGNTTYLLLWNPDLADARRQPMFKRLVTELGMVGYWRSTGNWGDFCRPLVEDDFECS